MRYPFFDKKGRPTKGEREICRRINNMIHDDIISLEDVEKVTNVHGVPKTQEELEIVYSLITGEETKAYKNTKLPPRDDRAYENIEFKDAETNTEDIDFEEDIDVKPKVNLSMNDLGKDKGASPLDSTPFDKPVVDRAYTKGIITDIGGEQDIPSASQDSNSVGSQDQQHSQNREGVKFDDTDFVKPIEQDIPEPDWASGMTRDSDDNQLGLDGDDIDADTDIGGDKLGGDNLEGLSPAQKRKAAEKTADALLNMYCQFAPMPFKHWASISERKVKEMAFEDKIDLSLELEDNVTVKEYIDNTNQGVEEVFTVSEETREEIKEPLIDVLLENDLALTPTQRLMIAVGSHVVQMGFSAYQLAQNNKVALEAFERYHKDRKEKTIHSEVNQSRPSSASTKKASRPTTDDDFDMNDKEAIRNMMREMDSDNDNDKDDDVIDGHNDPNIEITEEY